MENPDGGSVHVLQEISAAPLEQWAVEQNSDGTDAEVEENISVIKRGVFPRGRIQWRRTGGTL